MLNRTDLNRLADMSEDKREKYLELIDCEPVKVIRYLGKVLSAVTNERMELEALVGQSNLSIDLETLLAIESLKTEIALLRDRVTSYRNLKEDLDKYCPTPANHLPSKSNALATLRSLRRRDDTL